LVVALDGLDDLPADSDVPDLWPPAGALPPGCYLVLSSRPGVRTAAKGGLRRVRSVPDHFCEVRIGPDEPEHRAVLRSYVAKRLARPRPDGQGPLPAAWADPLIDQAGGSFLYVFHYCRALHFGVYTDLAQLPPQVAYYPAFFEHLRGRVGDELFKLNIPRCPLHARNQDSEARSRVDCAAGISLHPLRTRGPALGWPCASQEVLDWDSPGRRVMKGGTDGLPGRSAGGRPEPTTPFSSGASTSAPGRGRALGRAANVTVGERSGPRLARSSQADRSPTVTLAISDPETALPLTDDKRNAGAAQRRPGCSASS
jgi:hypothetical protein